MLRTEAGTSETPSPAATKLNERRGLGDLVRRAGLEAVGGAGVLDGVVDDGVDMRRVGHEGLALQALERDRVGAGERVGLWEDGEERLGSEDLGAPVALVDRRAQEPDVERSVGGVRDLVGG